MHCLREVLQTLLNATTQNHCQTVIDLVKALLARTATGPRAQRSDVSVTGEL